MRVIWPFRHFGLKLLSVGLALSLWLVVSGEETAERTLRVPLELQQFPPGLELVGEAPSNVDVRVRGASGTLVRAAQGDVVAALDLRGARPGRRLFHLTPDEVRTPFGLEVLQVDPGTVALTFESSATRSVAVTPEIDGRPAPGYVVAKTTVTPQSVDVVGPESAVKRATEAVTEPVSVAGAREPVTDTVTVGLVDPSLRLKGVRSASVTVQIVPAPLERTLRDLPVHLRNLAPNVSAQAIPPVVTVSVRGTREALNRIEPDEVPVYVDVAGLGSGTYTLTVRADNARDAGVTRVEPPAVQVRISRER